MATIAKIRENYLGVFIGLIVAIAVFFMAPKYNECKELIKAIPQLTMCIFGFLLTLLGIILQGDGPVIKRMKDSAVLFERFVNYNKKIVLLSFALSMVAFFAGYVDYSWCNVIIEKIDYSYLVVSWKVFLSCLSWSCVWLVVDTITFVNIFYILIRKAK